MNKVTALNITAGTAVFFGGTYRTVVAVGEDVQGERVVVLQAADTSIETVLCGPFVPFHVVPAWEAALMAG